MSFHYNERLIQMSSFQPSGASNSKEDSESGSEEESSDEEERKAPNQLIMEFLQCVMDNDTENGLKLCKMSKSITDDMLTINSHINMICFIQLNGANNMIVS